jgi:hypothetical protein
VTWYLHWGPSIDHNPPGTDATAGWLRLRLACTSAVAVHRGTPVLDGVPSTDACGAGGVQALKSAAEEYSRVLDVVSRYAAYKTGVGFSCKKQVGCGWVLSVRRGCGWVLSVPHGCGRVLSVPCGVRVWVDGCWWGVYVWVGEWLCMCGCECVWRVGAWLCARVHLSSNNMVGVVVVSESHAWLHASGPVCPLQGWAAPRWPAPRGCAAVWGPARCNCCRGHQLGWVVGAQRGALAMARHSCRAVGTATCA